MEYTQSRVRELLQTIPWKAGASIRLFWIRCSERSRSEFASQLTDFFDTDAVIALVIRSNSFFNANAVLSDVMELFQANRTALEALNERCIDRLTVLLLAKDNFRLITASSPITLPDWFPICPGTETYFYISDLGQTAEVKPLNCPEARLENVSELFFQVEEAIVRKLRQIRDCDELRVAKFLEALQLGGPPVTDPDLHLAVFTQHIESIEDPRAYRPNAAQDSKFLAARMLKLALNCSPKQLGAIAKDLSEHIGSDEFELKPTFFAIMWRPAAKMAIATSNWHAILVSLYQAYQLMNANAHAGEYPAYAIELQHATSVNLRTFLSQAKDFVESLE